MNKIIVSSLISLISIASYAENDISEFKNITQPPVITSEFKVKQGDQALYETMEKDTNKIKLESDNFGLKTLQAEMTPSKIKERLILERQKLADETTHLERYPYPKK